MKQLLRILCAIIFLATSSLAYGVTFTVGDLTYTTSGSTAEVKAVNTNVTSVNIPETVQYNGSTYTVTSIGNSAFYNCTSLAEIIIPNSVTEIGNSAFWGCSSLARITIPNSVTEIESYAFTSCSSLAEITIPNSVTSIGNNAFYGCSGLKEVTIEDGETTLSLGYNSSSFGQFGSCPLEKVYIGRNLSYSSNSSDGYSPFGKNTKLTSFTIGSKVTEIGDCLLYGCSSLAEITIPNSVTSIGSSAFSSCSSLAEISIPNSVTSIGSSAFYGCSSLAEITIPNSVTEIGINAFNSCSGLKEMKIEDGDAALSLGYNWDYSSRIGSGQFSSCPLEKVYIGRNLSYNSGSSYGYSPFAKKTKLTSVTIGSYVTSIGKYLFYECSSLAEITIPNSVTSIESCAFEDCSSLSEITIPHYVTSIGSNAFSNCSSLAEITIPNSVTSIGNYAFDDCSGLKEVKIEDSDTTLSLGYNSTSSGVFGACPLEKVYIGRNLSYNSGSSYGYSPFAQKTKLTSVTIGSCVTEIDDYLFYNCSSLTEITIPNSVTSIGNYVFNGCSGLKEVKIEDGDTILALGYNYYPGSPYTGYGLFKDCPLEKVYMGRNLSYESRPSYGYSPFAKQTKLTSVSIGSKVTEIGKYLFCECSFLTEITIPNSVTEIEDYAFDGCKNLESIYYDPGVDFINFGSNNFDSIFNTATLYVLSPEKTIEILNNNAWNQFSKIFNKENDKIYVPTGWGPNLKASNSYFANERGCLSELNSTINLKASGNVLMAIYGGEDIRSELESEDGFSFIPSEYWKFNYIYGASADSIDSRTVNIASAGNLFNELGFQDIEKITSLKISGNLNGTDIMTINRMTSLKNLDISEANIVEGGQTYRENLKTQDNIIGSYFFSDCRNLTNVILSNTAVTIASKAFYGMSNTENILIGNSIEIIDTEAFSGCFHLVSITIPNSVKAIENWAFSRCSRMKEVNIEDGETTLSLGHNVISNSISSLFGDCPLEKVYIGRNLRYSGNASDGYSPFAKQTGLTSLTIGSCVTSLGINLFNGCSSLSEITIPNSVTTIGASAFMYCLSLSRVNISDLSAWCSISFVDFYSNPLSYAKHLYLNNKLLTDIVIPDDITSIKNYAFYNGIDVYSVTIPNSVTSIGNYAFSGCLGMKELTLGTKLTSIGNNGFAGCSNLAKIRSLNPTPPEINSSVFMGVDKETCQLIVTKGNLVYYWLDPVWKEFLNISDDIVYLSPLPAVTYGDEPVDLSLYAPEGVTFTYESSNPDVALIDGTMLSIVGAGRATIGAIYDQSGTPMEIIGQMRQFVVDKADLTIEVESVSINEGQPIPAFTLKAKGLVYGETLEDVGVLPVAYCEANEDSAPGEYPIYLVGGESQNYKLNLVAGVLTILGKDTSAIDEIKIDDNFGSGANDEADGTVHVFNYNGVLIYEGPEDEMVLEKGIYILVKGKESKKMLVK
ncbi:MAG: leucine-rich repeat protein [Muribaculaceae bacterium]|nr:leucine-rich repeat protein [Muribaculaceae bacterium]